MIPYHILVLHLANCHDFSVYAVLLEIFADAKVDLDLLDGIHALVKYMLYLVNFTEATFAEQLLFVK